MAESNASESSAIQGRSFLVIDTNNSNLDKLERYLLMDSAAKVYKAKSSLLALRILQDRRTPVDCIICTQKITPISGLDVLQNLRTGRYGGKTLRETPFILMMKQKEDAIVHAADSLLVNGHLIGELNRELLTNAVNGSLGTSSAKSPPRNCRIAHVRESGLDLILVPFESNFGKLPFEDQQKAIDVIYKNAILAGLKGEVIPIWPSGDDRTSFIAPQNYHAVVERISMDFVNANLNRQFTPIGFSESVNSALPGVANSDRGKKTKGSGSSSMSGSKSSGNGSGDESDDQNEPSTPFSDEHIRKVMAAFKQLGPETFVKAFVRSQPIIRRGEESKFDTLMTEFYVSVGRLRKPLFANAEMRGCGLVFNDLTLLLDQIVLRSFDHIPVNGGLFSINLNVQSVFTKAFEKVFSTVDTEKLIIEFRQPNIIEYFDEYEVARGLLLSKGAKIAVDQIFPDTLGLVNLELLGASIAKFQWTKDNNDCLRERTRALKHMIDHDIEPIMTRVDETSAMELGEEIGVHRFQGFLIDKMVSEQQMN